ncbi:hypothetical protein MFUL124B02_05390 [Myxococcus fulvus 124B02]|nr:hypothetical protein MFUL124B02_05390 [Myxococcus fulvus 124B02]
MTLSIKQSAKAAEDFLKDYLRRNEYFTPANELTDSDDATELRLCLTQAKPGSKAPDVIYFFFKYGQVFDEGDPELSALVKQCMDALVAAHPEVMQFKHELYVDPAR